jgi:cysteine-rich repeat protein
MNLLPRNALGLLVLSIGTSLSCQMSNPAYDFAEADETRGTGDGDEDSAESNASGDGDPSTGDGDPSTGDGDPSTGDGDPSTGDGDGDPTTGDGDPSTGDGDPTGDGDLSTGDGDGEPAGFCGDGVVDVGEECDDGNDFDEDNCTNSCTFFMPDMDGGMLECSMNMNPQTCHECVSTFCCFPLALDCVDSMACACVVGCLLEGMNSEMICHQTCGAEQSDIDLVPDALPCMQEMCMQQCSGG